MATVMQFCPTCREYTLEAVCPRDGAKTIQNVPMRYSPEDNYGEYRRRLKKLDAQGAAPGDDRPEAGH